MRTVAEFFAFTLAGASILTFLADRPELTRLAYGDLIVACLLLIASKPRKAARGGLIPEKRFRPSCPCSWGAAAYPSSAGWVEPPWR
jgi:hypothetical protein